MVVYFLSLNMISDYYSIHNNVGRIDVLSHEWNILTILTLKQ